MRRNPFWFDRFPKSRRPSYPRIRGEHTSRVVIVGGGLTGAACALTFAVAGIDAVLLEADVSGGGVTAGDAGLIREGFAASFHDTTATYGLRTARALWDGMRRSGLDCAAALRRYRIRCDLDTTTLVTFAAADPETGRSLRREYQTRREAEVEGAWIGPAAIRRETGLESSGGIRTRAMVLDPYRACVGLVTAAAERGARIYEHSAVRRIRPTKRHVDVVTESGAVRAELVVVATGAAIQDLRPLRRHLRAEQVYGVVTEPLSSRVKRQLAHREALLEPAAERNGIVRWIRDDRAFVQGGRQPQIAERTRDRALVQRTGQLMYELLLMYPDIVGLQPAWAWDAVDYETVDGLPFLGPHRNFPRHFFAFGAARHGLGLAWTAARLAIRHFQGAPSRGDEAFGFQRIL